MNPLPPPQLRVARPSRDLDATTRFYTQALDFEVLASFADRAGSDGVMLGHAGWPYHFEFTRRRADPIQPQPTEEDLLVLYFPDVDQWNAMTAQMRRLGAPEVKSPNPYWNANGATFEDPDGYRIVLQNAPWP